MYIPFRQIPIAAANDRCDNPRDRNLACLQKPETFPILEYAENACFVTQEVGILCPMSGGC